MRKMENKRVLEIINKMNIEEKLLCVHGQLWDPYRANQAAFIRGNERLGIPDFFIADGESGVNISFKTTAFPSKVSLASTFDRNCAFEYGRAMGMEAKSAGVHLLLTPRVNIARDPVSYKGVSNGGNYQTYSEDPILNGEMGAQEALGIQHNNNALANLKQMYGSSNGTAQGAGNCIIDEQTRNELYMRPFEIVLKSGVASAMTNYNQINGNWTYNDSYMVKECARGKWGFKGFVFNDWFCLYDPNAIRHGATLEMPGEDYYDEGSESSWYGKKLVEAIGDENQPVTMEDLDNAVYYYLDTLDRFGMLDEKQRIPCDIDENTKNHSINVCRKIAAKGAVLLKNEENILPIDFKDKKVAIIGAGGANQVMPTFKEASYGFSDRKDSVYNLLQNEYGENITFADGIDLDGEVIPSDYLKPSKDSEKNGLKRYKAQFTYDTLSNGNLEKFPISDEYEIDKEINYIGENQLPKLPRDRRKEFFKEAPKKYYMWHGYLCPKETGLYRISMQSKFPGVEVFNRNEVDNGDLSIPTSGNLYIRKSPDSDNMERIGIGTRIYVNGAADPYSEVVQCKDGWNNAGGYVCLESGEEYEIYFNHTCLYLEPLEMRLAWTTPTAAKKALNKAVDIAKDKDVVLMFAWHQSVSESMTLVAMQDKLIDEVAKTNSDTIVVLNTGDPIEMPWCNDVKAIVEMWFSGQEGALATLDILSGTVNPAGRLPITFPKKLEDIAARNPNYPERYAIPGRVNERDVIHSNTAHFTEGLLNGYRWFDEMDIEPLFPFGYGLSYTQFKYSQLKAELSDGILTVRFLIKNIGDVDGEEVSQLYLGRAKNIPDGVKTVPKMFMDFQRTFLNVGETKEVIFNVDGYYTKYFDTKTREYKSFNSSRSLLVGASSRDIRLETSINI